MLAMFGLCFVMDAFEIIFVVVPIVAPALLKMPGVDPVWLGILMAVNLQTSYLHPPLGPTLFYLRGVAPPQITTMHIYVGVIPFVLIQLGMLVMLWFWPGLASWLPHAFCRGVVSPRSPGLWVGASVFGGDLRGAGRERRRNGCTRPRW
jgi:TRAP-type mannitol/chloroaromatic compound transport system permease large subunit